MHDVGLMRVTPGPRGGLVKATCKWLPPAYSPPLAARKDTKWCDTDDHALARLAAGLPKG
jgi:hypothetical protein